MEISQVHDLLKDTLAPDVTLSSWTLLKQRPGYAVWDVTVEHPSMRLVVKTADPAGQAIPQFERVASLYEEVRARTNMDMPQILLADDSCRRQPLRALVKTYLQGVEYAYAREQMTPQELSSAQAQIGDIITRLHGIQFPGFGELLYTESGAACVSCFEALELHARRIILHPADRERFLSAVAPYQASFAGITPSCLCHEDLHAYNLLFKHSREGWQFVTVLDFEKAWAGPREADLARMDLWKMTGEPFWSSYNARMPVDPGYPARRAVLQLLWCLEVAWDTDEHRATTSGVLSELAETNPDILPFKTTFGVFT